VVVGAEGELGDPAVEDGGKRGESIGIPRPTLVYTIGPKELVSRGTRAIEEVEHRLRVIHTRWANIIVNSSDFQLVGFQAGAICRS
jgi:hypothetical protein